MEQASGDDVAEQFEAHRDDIVGVFAATEAVIAAYLFGSVASGDTGPLSDIDFAIYLNEALRSQEMTAVKLDVIDALSRYAGDAIDVVLLNTAPPVLRYTVIADGSLLYEQDEDRRAVFEAHVMSTALDRQPHDALAGDIFLERVQERGFV